MPTIDRHDRVKVIRRQSFNTESYYHDVDDPHFLVKHCYKTVKPVYHSPCTEGDPGGYTYYSQNSTLVYVKKGYASSFSH